MKKFAIAVFILCFTVVSETLFQVKDSSDRVVLDVSTDGLRIFNGADTLMVISSSAIKAFIQKDANKALSRAFSVTTSSSTVKGNTNVLEITTQDTKMREGSAGNQYTDFSPENIFLGLNSGVNTNPGLPGSRLGKRNIFLGNESGISNQSGYENIMIGDSVGVSNSSGFFNTFIGNTAGYSNTSANRNVFIGFQSGYSNIDKGYNTFVGAYSGRSSTGFENTFIGCMSGVMNTVGYDNTHLGFWSGAQNQSGNRNTLVGAGAGLCNDGGSRNTLVGFLSGVGSEVTNNSDNCFFGFQSGYSINTGSNNVMFGSEAGYSNVSGSGNVFLGNKAGYNETLSNKLYIANSSTSTPLIKGTFPNTDLTFTASKFSFVHSTPNTNGLYILNNYQGNTDSWHFYQYTTKELALFYNTTKKGDFNITNGAYSHTSDKRMKKDIESLSSVTERVMKLEPKSYRFTSQKDDEKKYIGLIAQDVIELFPAFVNHTEEDDTYTIDYSGLSVVAIQSIKEQQSKIEDQERRIAKLEEAIEKLLK